MSLLCLLGRPPFPESRISVKFNPELAYNPVFEQRRCKRQNLLPRNRLIGTDPTSDFVIVCYLKPAEHCFGQSSDPALREETETADGEPAFCSRDVISRILLALVCVCIALHE